MSKSTRKNVSTRRYGADGRTEEYKQLDAVGAGSLRQKGVHQGLHAAIHNKKHYVTEKPKRLVNRGQMQQKTLKPSPFKEHRVVLKRESHFCEDDHSLSEHQVSRQKEEAIRGSRGDSILPEIKTSTNLCTYKETTCRPTVTPPKYDNIGILRGTRFQPYMNAQNHRSQRHSPDSLMGIPNIGMTCYANSLIQVLGQTPGLLKHMESLSSGIHSARQSITLLFTKVLREINSKSSATKRVSSSSINSLLRSVCSRDYEFSIGEQNDCHLFMTKLFSLIKEEIHDPSLKPMKIFEGLLQSHFIYESCGHEEDSQEQMFGSLLIPLGKNIDNYSVYRGIQDLCKEEVFREDELPCRKCSRRSSSAMLRISSNTGSRSTSHTRQKTKLKKLPEILVLQLGRFREVSMFGRNALAKLDKEVSYPDTLKLGSNEGEVVYQLYGVVNHSGTLSGGHYTANVRRDISEYPDSPWFCCSDSHVHVIGDSVGRSSRSVYLLFYWKLQSYAY